MPTRRGTAFLLALTVLTGCLLGCCGAIVALPVSMGQRTVVPAPAPAGHTPLAPAPASPAEDPAR